LPASIARDQRELDFQLALVTPFSTVFGHTGPEVEAAHERASTLCESLGDAGRLFAALGLQFSYRTDRGQNRAARQLVERCKLLAEGLEDPVYQTLTHRVMGLSCMQHGALPEARRHFEQSIGTHDSRDDCQHWRYPVHLTELLWIMGFPEQAMRASCEAFREAEHGNADHKAHAWWHAGALMDLHLYDWKALRKRADEAIALAPGFHAAGKLLRGWVIAHEGEAREGLALIKEGIAAAELVRARYYWPLVLALLADGFQQAEDLNSALCVIAEAHDVVGTTEEHLWHADIYIAVRANSGTMPEHRTLWSKPPSRKQSH
jgi:hypothetical protein